MESGGASNMKEINNNNHFVRKRNEVKRILYCLLFNNEPNNSFELMIVI